MMRRCIELSRTAISEGEYPFGAVVAFNGRIVAEATNRQIREKDVSRHAEVIALSRAQKELTREELSKATIYIKPCAMCFYGIREACVGRVVFALSSPVMGGLSKWSILRDQHLSRRVPLFGPPPEVLRGLLGPEAQQVWREWNPVAWELAKLRGIITEQPVQTQKVKRLPAQPESLLHHLIVSLGGLRRRALDA